MKDPKQVWAWVGVVVVLIGIVVVVAGNMAIKGGRPSGASAAAAVAAPKGELAPGFPKDLVLDPHARIDNSYSINYSATTNQYTAQWESSSSLASLYGSYKAYLGTNGWTVANESDLTSSTKLAVVYGQSASAKANVTIVAQGNGAQVTISYVSY